MEYIFYCVISAIAIIVSCVGTMTKRIKWYQYIIMMTILAFIIYYFYGKWGQLLTPFIVGGIILISSILIKQHFIPNVCIGLSIHLLNCVLNNFLLWGIGCISPHILEILYNEEILVFPIFWLFFLLIMTSIYRKILYEKCDILRYFNVSKKIKIGIIIEMVFFGLLYSMNIVWGERIGYTPRMLGYNSSFLLICFLINVMLFLYLGYAVKVEENQQLLIQKYKDLENYAISLENYDNNMKELRHDFKNILSSIAGYIRVDDIENLKRFFQKEILSVFAENTSISYISDTMKRIQSVELKSFLYEKILKASAINVVIHCEVNTKIIFNNVNIVDMIRVMGIYLDNAIEAAEESVGKEIWLYFIDDDTKLLIGIENTFDDSKMYFENIGQKGFSTKGKERGLGVCSARKILGKYKHVFLETSIENQLFKQSIIIEK